MDNNKSNDDIEYICQKKNIWKIFHMICTIIAVYLSAHYNIELNIISIIIAIIFPYFYIIYKIIDIKYNSKI
jgi:hypothetical protein